MSDFNRTPEAQEIFSGKRRPKAPIKKLNTTLNDEQKGAKQCAYEKDVSFIMGKAASGKTLCATNIALDMYFKGDVQQIIVCRPFDFKATGYLVGGLEEKLQYHMMPILHNFYQAYDNTKIDEMYKTKAIKILPIPYLRGCTFVKAVVIVDELQEMSYEDFELVLTRLGRGSKLIFTGSLEQNVLGDKSCINKVMKLKDSGLVCFTELTANHRNESIFEILDYLKK
jgi:phosphate starvation-inducible protein PhoH